MARIRNYEEQVYAGVLGKVIGVYMGRPFEGWHKSKIEQTWGRVDRYVHEDRGVGLVVADDDISGTLTFVRALEDSGLYADTPEEFFGQTWLNYLIEGKTVLWWGGMGRSTEHTAYLRLKHGVPSPRSGSIELNGPVVAEQIGGQIFIDAFGLVAPGRPKLAAALARKAAGVSHDGEAVHGAVVVAGMISAAFVQKDMGRLLDIGVGLIPADSLIAGVHRDVRAWRGRDRDWRKTYSRIEKKYGYTKYGGSCHVVPNHALMVMAWSYAPDDFHEAQTIVNTAGWDTDCNAANVGALMGVKVGLAGINAKYDFQGPTADRILLPTAEGTRSATDALTEALHVARIGRRVMGWATVKPPKKGAWHHFQMPGALHGYRCEEDRFETRGAACVENVAASGGGDARAMRIAFEAGPGRIARVSTPVLPRAEGGGGYDLVGTPRLYSGMKVTLRGQVGPVTGDARACLFVRHYQPLGEPTGMAYSRPVRLREGRGVSVSLEVPDTGGWPAVDFGIEVRGDDRAVGELLVDGVWLSGQPQVAWGARLPLIDNRPVGWIADADVLHGPHRADAEDLQYIGKNEGRGVLVTGTTDWRDYTFQARLKIHLADTAGILIRYQGLQRYIALVKTGDKLQLIRRHYGETVLAERRRRWRPGQLHEFRLTAETNHITAWCDGRKLLEATDDTLFRGGAGFLFDNGLIAFRDTAVHPAP